MLDMLGDDSCGSSYLFNVKTWPSTRYAQFSLHKQASIESKHKSHVVVGKSLKRSFFYHQADVGSIIQNGSRLNCHFLTRHKRGHSWPKKVVEGEIAREDADDLEGEKGADGKEREDD